MAGELPGEMRIGEVLSSARERAGLDLRAVEDRTKIRLKYLQALEDEQWDQLPSDAYAKGFLRTYAQLLGLDADALVDEFRRQVEPGASAGSGYPVGRRPSEPGSRPGTRPRSRLPVWLALGAIAAVGALLVVGFVGGDEDEDPGTGSGGTGGRSRPAGGDSANAERKTVSMTLSVIEPVEVCLLGGAGEALIDGQVLAAGAEEAFERRELELRFPKGFAADQFRLEIDGDPRRLPRADGPAAYAIIPPGRVEQRPAPKQGCP